jgi:hypothetical protein
MVGVVPIARQEVEHVDQSRRWVSGGALCLHAAGRYHIGSFWPVDKCAADVAFRAEGRWTCEVKGVVLGDIRLSPALRDRAAVEGAGCDVAISIKLAGCLMKFSFPKRDNCRVGKEKKEERM